MYLLFLCSLFSVFQLYGSYAQSTSTASYCIRVSNNILSQEEENELCELALKTVYKEDIINHSILKPHLQRIINQSNYNEEDDDSPLYILRRMKSRHEDVVDDPRKLYELVVKATSQALEEKLKESEQKQKEIDDKYSKLEIAAITSITSIITTVCGVIITAYS